MLHVASYVYFISSRATRAFSVPHHLWGAAFIHRLGIKRASRARSRTDVRLGRASRACSPPICTILRRLIKLVCALLRFRERSRTIEVQLTTLSAQNTRKISRPKLLGSVYPFVSLPAAHYKSFIFSFKISVIFVKLVC